MAGQEEKDLSAKVRVLPPPTILSQAAGGRFMPPLPAPPSDASASTMSAPAARIASAPAVTPAATIAPAAKLVTRERVAPTSPMFRERALQRYRRGEGVAEVLEVSGPLAWTLAWGVSALVVIATLFAIFGRIEVVSRARGVMRPLDGVVAVAARVEGLVSQVHVTGGQTVHKGDRLISVDSAPIRAQLLAAQRKLELADEQLSLIDSSNDRLRGQASALLGSQAKLARRDIARQRSEILRFEQRLAGAARLEAKGVMSEREVDALRSELSQGRRALLAMERELAGSHLEDNRVKRDYTQLEREWLARRKEALAELETAQLLLSQTEVRAPLEGTIESLLVRPGHQVAAATSVGRIIPRELSDRVVVFIPERDRAFVKPGAHVRLEIDQLPVGEFGGLSGRVVRVAQAIATAAEIADVLGPQTELTGPNFRVEVALLDNDKRLELAPYLRTGAMVTGRITLRKQRIIALVMRPLRGMLRE